MDFYITSPDLIDTGVIPDKSVSLDIDIGGDSDNDFELSAGTDVYDSDVYQAGGFIYCPGTEYGGLFGDPEVDTANDKVTFTGDTFRGLLTYKYVEPASGEDYRYVSGNLDDVIESLMSEAFGEGLFTVDHSGSYPQLANYKLSRNITLLECINDICGSVDYKPVIKAVAGSPYLSVLVSAEPVEDLSELVELSSDMNVYPVIKTVTRKYNYMLSLGSGELKDRMTLRLHLKDDGTVEEVDSFPAGLDVRIYKYDYPNVESEDDLLSESIKKFSEINPEDSASVSLSESSDIDIPIGDVIGSRDYITGRSVKSEIVRKIVTYKRNKLTISYKCGDGSLI